MPVGIISAVWNGAAQQLRITYANNRPDSVFTPADIPSNIFNQGPQAVQDWMNANAAQFLWGAAHDPPFFRCVVHTTTPLFTFDYGISNEPIPAGYFTPPTPGPT